MRVVVSGLTGCIGQALARDLMGRGHEVVAIVRPGCELPSACEGVGRAVGDLTRPLDMAQLPETADAVIHMAQARRYREFPAAAGEMLAINTAATSQLAEYAVKAKARSFVFTSTGSIYVPQAQAVAEDAVTSPASYYAASKIAGETLLAPFAGLLPVAILRLFYVYGPGQTGMLIDGLAGRVRQGTPVSLHRPDGITVAPLFSGDAARIVRSAAEEAWAGTLNVGSTERVTLRGLAMALGEAIGRDPVIEMQDAAAPNTVLPDVTRLAQRFDLSTLTPLAQGLAATFGAGLSADTGR